MTDLAIVLFALALAEPDGTKIGERPALERRLDQEAVDRGAVGLRELIDYGRALFDARFNRLDGQGRPASTGGGAARTPDQPAFIRTSAPDADSCVGCHAQPASGGSGDFVANVFVLAQNSDPVTQSVEGSFSNERNTLGMMGSGPIEMLAREMTAELFAIREEARGAARSSGITQTRPLVAKGISFGTITVHAGGKVDPSGIEGVDWDLIVKPFHQKGVVVSLREFSSNAMNHHHGMQSAERFGFDTDPDGDGMRNELLPGDITAITVFQAALNTPGQVLPHDPARRQAIANGARWFEEIQCASCHVPALRLNDRNFTEPNPFNPPGNLSPEDVAAPFRFDMTREGPGPRLERAPGGGAIVRAFTDLKRHDLSDADYGHFANEQVPQGKLTGFALPSEFTIAPAPRPTRQFLTRKLWDVGNTGPYGHRGDLTLITDAIDFHGGEARASRDAFFALPQERRDEIVEFLKSLQVLSDGAARFVHEGED